MGGLETTLPPAFSLLKSEFNEFLFAPIGEEKNHSVLTVLSALARLGIDPWQESARLAQMSRDAAMKSLAAIIAQLPNGTWTQPDSDGIAARLVELLPTKRAAETTSTTTGTGSRKPKASSSIVMIVVVAALTSWMLFAIMGRNHPTTPDADNPVSTTTASPSAPLGDSR